MDMAVKTQLYLCNIQGVSVYINVSANYMFRPKHVVGWDICLYTSTLYVKQNIVVFWLPYPYLLVYLVYSDSDSCFEWKNNPF